MKWIEKQLSHQIPLGKGIGGQQAKLMRELKIWTVFISIFPEIPCNQEQIVPFPIYHSDLK